MNDSRLRREYSPHPRSRSGLLAKIVHCSSYFSMRVSHIAKIPVAATLLLLAQIATAQQVCDGAASALSTPSSRFAVNDDGTVTDRQTRLMWVRCASGQHPAGKDCSGTASLHDWQSLQETVASLNQSGDLFYSDWRVPTLRELATITERQCNNPRANLAIFPQMPAQYFWTSSTQPGRADSSLLYALSFGRDGVRLLPKDRQAHARLVRNAQ